MLFELHFDWANYQLFIDLQFLLAPPKKFGRRASSISMLPTFHIASLNRYTLKFSGVA